MEVRAEVFEFQEIHAGCLDGLGAVWMLRVWSDFSGFRMQPLAAFSNLIVVKEEPQTPRALNPHDQWILEFLGAEVRLLVGDGNFWGQGSFSDLWFRSLFVFVAGGFLEYCRVLKSLFLCLRVCLASSFFCRVLR